MLIVIRAAARADQPAITALVRAAQINPTELDWRRFLVADRLGQVVGTGQIKPHRDGSRELASLAVAPAQQGAGVGRALLRALLRRVAPPIYLMCLDEMEGYYTRHGFRTLAPAAMPPVLRRRQRMGGWLMRTLRRPYRPLVMVWEGA